MSRPEGQLRELGFPQVSGADPQVPGQVVLSRRAAELLGQLPGDRADFKCQVFCRAIDMNLPSPVPEVPLDLAAYAWLGVGGQGAGESDAGTSRLGGT
ncbi:MAG TPA: hypothetical protein VHJ18_04605 [Streptosporangiaceae bacterium]|nr:hypothetical protein [Streptosporangiaceae bacterium]